MTKKDYIRIAAILRDAETEAKASDSDRVRRSIAAELCSVFAEDNPRFDAMKFLKAANAYVP